MASSLLCPDKEPSWKISLFCITIFQHFINHYRLVIIGYHPLQWHHMSTKASQMIGNLTVCSTACSGHNQVEHQSSALVALNEGNPPLIGGFTSQRASNAVAGDNTGTVIMRHSTSGFVQMICYLLCVAMGQYYAHHIDGLVQDCSNSIANTLELLQSCTKPSISSRVISLPLVQLTLMNQHWKIWVNKTVEPTQPKLNEAQQYCSYGRYRWWAARINML